MKPFFGRREKYLYRRHPVYASFISGTKFGVAVGLLVLLATRLL